MNKNNILIEIATFTPHSAIVASQGGADRVELCSGFSEGGLSPSAGSIRYVRSQLSIPVHVMIRPRVGDFVYNEVEKKIIIQDIEFCKQEGINGIVFGALAPSGNIDLPFTRAVVDAARPMSVTFHRAFDLCHDLHGALNDLMQCGVDRVLTSGGKPSAPQATGVITDLVKQAGENIIILPGGGLTPENIAGFVAQTGVSEVHFSAKKLIRGKAMENREVSLISEGQVDDYNWYECDPQQISMLKKQLVN